MKYAAWGIRRAWRCCPFSNFGNPAREKTIRIRRSRRRASTAVRWISEYDGEMSAEVALDPQVMELDPSLPSVSGPANVLIMPALHTANIAAGLLQELGNRTRDRPHPHGARKTRADPADGRDRFRDPQLRGGAGRHRRHRGRGAGRRIAEEKAARSAKSKKAAAGTRKLKKRLRKPVRLKSAA